jgi:hypothetical protein
MPRRSASARSGRCGESGLILVAVALFHGSMLRSRAAATSAPAKFGTRAEDGRDQIAWAAARRRSCSCPISPTTSSAPSPASITPKRTPARPSRIAGTGEENVRRQGGAGHDCLNVVNSGIYKEETARRRAEIAGSVTSLSSCSSGTIGRSIAARSPSRTRADGWRLSSAANDTVYSGYVFYGCYASAALTRPVQQSRPPPFANSGVLILSHLARGLWELFNEIGDESQSSADPRDLTEIGSNHGTA